MTSYQAGQFAKDAAKASSRALIGDFFAKHRPEPFVGDLRFLLGDSCAEAETYLTRGFPASQLVGAEILRAPFERAQAENTHGITTYHGDILSAELDKRGKIGGVSIDLLANYSRPTLALLGEIFAKPQRLTDNFLLYIGLQARRENT